MLQVSSCQKWHLEAPCLLQQENCRHLESPQTLPGLDISLARALFWGCLTGSGHLLALQVPALPCPTSSVEVAALPSSPRRPTLRNTKCLFSCSLSGSSQPNPVGDMGRTWKLLEASSQGLHCCGCDLQSCWQSWGEHPMRAEQGGEGRGAILVLGVARKANFRCDNIRIWGEISRCVAAFLQSLMDLFRRSTAVGANYTVVGRQCSKIKRGNTKIKKKNKTK